MKAPLDYRRPGRGTIDVAMIRKRATGPERKRIGSLLFNFGGPGQFAFDRFAEHCARAYDDCPLGSDPAQANQRVLALLNRLKKEPAPAGGDQKLSDSLAARAIGNYLDLGESGWEPLVGALREVMERGNGSALLEKGYDHGPKSRAASDGGSTSAFVAITCADSGLRPGFFESEKMIKRITAASPVFGETWSSTVYLCHGWPFEGESATFDVSADGAAPILVVANTGDPTTPYAGAKRMVDELGEGVGVLLTVRAEGHGSYPHIRCAARAVDAYLINGDTPAATCGA